MFRVLVIVGLCLSVVLAGTENRRVVPNKHGVTELDNQTYDEFIAGNTKSMVLWYSPKCSICKRAQPNYERAAKYSSIPLGRINILEHKDLGDKNDVDGYPTVYFFRNGKRTEYHGSLKTAAILEYLSQHEK